MYTPQEVRENSASFDRSVFGGYNMKSVDAFLTPLVEDYSALYKENAVLKSKMKVLVEKLEEFHEREDSMNKAILAAQKTADEMIVDTERKCAKMLSDTEETMRIRSQELKKEMAIEAERVNRAKKTAAAFILHVEEQMHKAVEQLESVREMSITPRVQKSAEMPVQPQIRMEKPAEPAPVAEPEAPVIELEPPVRETPEQVSRQIEVNISRIISGEAEPQEARQEPQHTPEERFGDTMVIHPIRD